MMVRGLKKVDQMFVLNMAAYNLVRKRSRGKNAPIVALCKVISGTEHWARTYFHIRLIHYTSPFPSLRKTCPAAYDEAHIDGDNFHLRKYSPGFMT